MYEAAWRRSGMIDLYWYCISIWYWEIFASCRAGVCQENDLRCATLYILTFKSYFLTKTIPFKGIIVGRGVPLLLLFKGQFKKYDLAG